MDAVWIHSQSGMLSMAVALSGGWRMTLAAISSETCDILSCSLYHSPNGQLVTVDLDRASQLYTPDRLDKFTDGSIIWLYKYWTNVAVMKQFCLTAAK